MNLTLDLKGVICPMLTPFDEQNQIDYESTGELVEFLIGHGIHGLMIGGTTSEGMLLSVEERKALTEFMIRQVGGRVPIIVHTGCIGTVDTIELTLHASDAGATAASLILPYFFTFDDDSLFLHFTSVARAAPDLPLFIYTFPGNAKNDLSPELLKRIRDAVPNIVGVKSSNPLLTRFQEYLAVGGEGFLAFNGVDGLMLPALAMGASGQVSGNANVFPEVFRDLYDAFEAGDLERARSQQALVDRIRFVLKDGLHPAYFKAALTLRGVSAGRVRAPMWELSKQELVQMEQGLRDIGLT